MKLEPKDRTYYYFKSRYMPDMNIEYLGFYFISQDDSGRSLMQSEYGWKGTDDPSSKRGASPLLPKWFFYYFDAEFILKRKVPEKEAESILSIFNL